MTNDSKKRVISCLFSCLHASFFRFMFFIDKKNKKFKLKLNTSYKLLPSINDLLAFFFIRKIRFFQKIQKVAWFHFFLDLPNKILESIKFTKYLLGNNNLYLWGYEVEKWKKHLAPRNYRKNRLNWQRCGKSLVKTIKEVGWIF